MWWPIIGISVFTAAVTWYEAPKLWKSNQKRDLGIFLILTLLAFGLSIALILDLTLPTPFDLVTFIFKPINHVIQLIL